MSIAGSTPRIPAVREVEVPRRELSRLEPLIGPARSAQLRAAAERAQKLLDGRTIWNVSSTSAGGGVAEMLHVLVGYTLDAAVDIRWLVIGADSEFFAITKRIHNRLHATSGDTGDLGPVESSHYDYMMEINTNGLLERIRGGDVVLLHDPQTAGLARALSAAGAHVVWRCHVGTESTNEWTDQAWGFLQPRLEPCEVFVFSMPEYVPQWMNGRSVKVIPPSIDPFSPKNQDLSHDDVFRILGRVGILGAPDDVPGRFLRYDESVGVVQRHASLLGSASLPIDASVPLVIQVSRWDRLKDMAGVMRGFASGVADHFDAHLALVGPSTGEVSDDPEGAEVFAECLREWDLLAPVPRSKVSLVMLPMDDLDENAAMVNALQRHAAVIVQKSLAEGFGLTVAEGMWKSRAVVASALGGIKAQITPGTGILVEDPSDTDAFGEILASLLEDPGKIASLGAAARRHVLDCYVGDTHLMRYAELLGELVS